VSLKKKLFTKWLTPNWWYLPIMVTLEAGCPFAPHPKDATGHTYNFIHVGEKALKFYVTDGYSAKSIVYFWNLYVAFSYTYSNSFKKFI